MSHPCRGEIQIHAMGMVTLPDAAQFLLIKPAYISSTKALDRFLLLEPM